MAEKNENFNCKLQVTSDCEFRWRYGFLKLDPSDKCEIFKSE